MPLGHRAALRFLVSGCAPLVCGIVLVGFGSSPALGQASAPQFSMDSVNIRQEGVVSFSTLFLAPDPRADFPEPRFLLGQTDDQSYRLYLDVDSIQQIRFNAFTFAAYLANAKEATRGAYKFQVTGNPTGSFRDAPVRVSFRVKNGTNNSVGTVLMPVYNATKTDLLLAERQAEPAYVSVSGTTPLQIRLTNPADTLPVAVTDVSVVENCLKCWTRVSSAVNEKSPLQIEPGTASSLPVDLSPNSLPALLQGALVVKTDVPHDTLSVTVTYHTLPGGADKKQTIPAQVRFGPGLFGLAMALCGGIALGLAARYLLTGKLGKDTERALHAVLTALVFGIIAEFVGIMMTAYGSSKLVLFGLDIDPRQLFPAFILAMLVSGGPAVVSWMKELFGKTA
jgi:hypothetical protein